MNELEIAALKAEACKLKAIVKGFVDWENYTGVGTGCPMCGAGHVSRHDIDCFWRKAREALNMELPEH